MKYVIGKRILAIQILVNGILHTAQVSPLFHIFSPLTFLKGGENRCFVLAHQSSKSWLIMIYSSELTAKQFIIEFIANYFEKTTQTPYHQKTSLHNFSFLFTFYNLKAVSFFLVQHARISLSYDILNSPSAPIVSLLFSSPNQTIHLNYDLSANASIFQPI